MVVQRQSITILIVLRLWKPSDHCEVRDGGTDYRGPKAVTPSITALLNTDRYQCCLIFCVLMGYELNDQLRGKFCSK